MKKILTKKQLEKLKEKNEFAYLHYITYFKVHNKKIKEFPNNN